MSQAEQIVSKFLKQEGVSKEIRRYVLRYAGRGRSSDEKEIETFEITEALAIEELANLASIVVARAQLDADGIGPSVQRYSVNSYTADSDSPSGRVMFRVRGASDVDLDGDGGDGVGDDSANPRGLLVQLMRHNEQNNRTMTHSMGAILTSMARRMESSDRMVERLMEDRFKAFEMAEEAMGRKHEREMEIVQVKAKEERIAFGISKVSILLPVILDKISGSKSSDSKDSLVLMLEELVGSLSVPQMETLRRSLGAEQQIVFLNVLKKFQERKALPSGDSGNGTPQKEN